MVFGESARLPILNNEFVRLGHGPKERVARVIAIQKDSLGKDRLWWTRWTVLAGWKGHWSCSGSLERSMKLFLGGYLGLTSVYEISLPKAREGGALFGKIWKFQ